MTVKSVQPAKTETFSPIPMNYLRLAGDVHVKALNNRAGLKKGEIYRMSLITDKGLVQLSGDIDNLYPMSYFARPIDSRATYDKAENA